MVCLGIRSFWVVFIQLFVFQGLMAKTLFQVVGGGYQGKASSSQVVLELNVQLFQSVAQTYGIGVHDSNLQVLFGSGPNSDEHDIVYQSQAPTPEQFASAILLGQSTDCLGCETRKNQIEGLSGDASKRSIQNILDQAGSSLTPADQHRFYFTGHGSHQSYFGRHVYDRNFIASWTRQLDVGEYSKALQKMPVETLSQTVMVQCYSGGFSQIIFKDGKAGGALSDHNHCGFFSQLADKPAAGCSPDANQRKEYSPYFWGAIRGELEDGRLVDADYNKDGVVSSAEAHAFVIIHEDSFDVPIKTSSELLRFKIKEIGNPVQDPSGEDLLSWLSEDETAIMDGLASGLEFQWRESSSILRNLKRSLQSTALSKQPNIASLNKAKQAKEDFFSTMKNDWLHQGLGPEHTNAQMSTLVQNLDGFQKYAAAYSEFENSFAEYLTMEHELAKWERLEYLVLSKAIEQELYKAEGLEDVKAKYQQLIACENQAFFH
jgi:hypothetical protein